MLVAEIARVHATGRPVLVGTASVEESEALAARLGHAGIESRVLNAKNDEREAATVAEAGALGAITISTNMAGRGTDIKLGGADERDRERVCALGGLYVIGCNLHESRRIDSQLRGRAGRQGDPGSSRFFVSLEDDLIERYGLIELIPDDKRERSDEAIDTPVINHRIAWAQRVIEGQNFDTRRTLERYSDIVERQRRSLQERRQAILVGRAKPTDCARAHPLRYEALARVCDPERVAEIERRVSLRSLDELWAEHLAVIAELREGIYMVGLGGQVPQHVFARRVGEAFRSLEESVDERASQIFERLQVTAEGVDLDQPGLRGPSSTWTYLVNDNPFGSAGHGLGIGIGQSIGAALMGPFVIAFGIYLRWRRRREGPHDQRAPAP
jgi:preprotein translocase subunit SecA